MKYVLLFVDEGDGPPADLPMDAVMAKVEEWWDEHSKSGEITGGERLQSPSRATTVRFGGPAPTVVDGPFIETKETIGGFAVIEVPDLDAALAMAKSWPASSAVEIRPVWED